MSLQLDKAGVKEKRLINIRFSLIKKSVLGRNLLTSANATYIGHASKAWQRETIRT